MSPSKGNKIQKETLTSLINQEFDLPWLFTGSSNISTSPVFQATIERAIYSISTANFNLIDVIYLIQMKYKVGDVEEY